MHFVACENTQLVHTYPYCSSTGVCNTPKHLSARRFTEVPLLWVKCTGEILTRKSQEVKIIQKFTFEYIIFNEYNIETKGTLANDLI